MQRIIVDVLIQEWGNEDNQNKARRVDEYIVSRITVSYRYDGNQRPYPFIFIYNLKTEYKSPEPSSELNIFCE